jgi:hypothetical protein
METAETDRKTSLIWERPLGDFDGWPWTQKSNTSRSCCRHWLSLSRWIIRDALGQVIQVASSSGRRREESTSQDGTFKFRRTSLGE